MTRHYTSVRHRHRQYVSLRPGQARLVRVTADLRHGVALGTDPWPIPLDGLLAAAVRRRRLGAQYGAVEDPHVEELPLVSTAMLGRPWAGNRWVWLASAAVWDDPDPPRETRYRHRRGWSVRAAEAAHVPTPTTPDVGRWKPWRLPTTISIVPTLTWWCMGDPDRIRDLLDDLPTIGDGHHTGDGAVHRWTVRSAGAPDWQTVIRTETGHPSRPIPIRHAPTLGLPPDTGRLVVDTYRPPYWRPLSSTAGRIPHLERVEVIAPWIRLP